MDYNKQTFEGVIRQSIKSFKQGKLPEQTLKSMSEEGKEVKYTPEYFDELEQQVIKEVEKQSGLKVKFELAERREGDPSIVVSKSNHSIIFL